MEENEFLLHICDVSEVHILSPFLAGQKKDKVDGLVLLAQLFYLR